MLQQQQQLKDNLKCTPKTPDTFKDTGVFIFLYQFSMFTIEKCEHHKNHSVDINSKNISQIGAGNGQFVIFLLLILSECHYVKDTVQACPEPAEGNLRPP